MPAIGPHFEFNWRPTLGLVGPKPAPLGLEPVTVLIGLFEPQLMPPVIGFVAKLPVAGCKMVATPGLTTQLPKIGFKPRLPLIGLEPQTVQELEVPPAEW